MWREKRQHKQQDQKRGVKENVRAIVREERTSGPFIGKGDYRIRRHARTLLRDGFV